MLVPSIFNHSFTDDLFNDVFPFGFGNNAGGSLMNADVQEFDDHYQVELELPGYKKEDIQAELNDGYLTIKAEHNETKDEKDQDGKYIRRERYSGHAQRSFYVGETVKQEDIKAGFENGILKLSVPKVTEKPAVEEKKYIAIE